MIVKTLTTHYSADGIQRLPGDIYDMSDILSHGVVTTDLAALLTPLIVEDPLVSPNPETQV